MFSWSSLESGICYQHLPVHLSSFAHASASHLILAPAIPKEIEISSDFTFCLSEPLLLSTWQVKTMLSLFLHFLYSFRMAEGILLGLQLPLSFT